jgi:hypothetical protein
VPGRAARARADRRRADPRPDPAPGRAADDPLWRVSWVDADARPIQRGAPGEAAEFRLSVTSADTQEGVVIADLPVAGNPHDDGQSAAHARQGHRRWAGGALGLCRRWLWHRDRPRPRRPRAEASRSTPALGTISGLGAPPHAYNDEETRFWAAARQSFGVRPAAIAARRRSARSSPAPDRRGRPRRRRAPDCGRWRQRGAEVEAHPV